MATLNGNITQTIKDFDDIKDAIEYKGVEVPNATPTSKYAEKIKAISTGITPSGTITITENGIHYDVTSYAYADINVPQGVFPEGSLLITENGTYDISSYAQANVQVPQGVFPEGTYEITENGTYNITNYANVEVNLPWGGELSKLIGGSGGFSMTIPDEVLSIRSYCFYQSNLYAVTISDSVEDIWDYAFSTTALAEIEIPGSVHLVGAFAFSNCYNLQDVLIENGMRDIRAYAFDNCSSLTNINLPDSVYHVGRDIISSASPYWQNSDNWENGLLYISNHVISAQAVEIAQFRYPTISIADDVFQEHPELVRAELPTELTSIGDGAFSSCHALESIGGNLPPNLYYIGAGAFSGCTALTGPIIIPESCEQLGQSVFSEAYNIFDVTILAPITRIPEFMFDRSSLSTVNFPETVISIGIGAFYGTKFSDVSSILAHENLEEIGDIAFAQCDELEALTIPENILVIGEAVFEQCKRLTSVVMEGTKTVGGYMFKNCEQLAQVDLSNAQVNSIAGWFANCAILSDVQLPDSLESIDADAFAGCSQLSQLPDGTYIAISASAFRSCIGLTDVVVPPSVTTIAGHAFENCTNITSIQLFDHIATIGEEAFYDCDQLTDVYYSGTEAQWTEVDIQDIHIQNATIHFN